MNLRIGKLVLAQDSTAVGVINVGGGRALGGALPQLQTAEVTFGDGDGTLNFNYQGTSTFSAALNSQGTGVHKLNHESGVTTLTGNSARFTGTATVSGGTLHIANPLGSSYGYIKTAVAGKAAEVSVEGSNANWALAMNLYVQDAGTLTVSNGAKVSNEFAVVGAESAESHVVVQGAGSEWLTRKALSVAAEAQNDKGQVTVSGGGKLVSEDAYISRYVGSAGKVVVTGADSSWQNSGELRLADLEDTTGVLEIRDGGHVTSKDSLIGSMQGKGEVLVMGSTSLWENTGQLVLGSYRLMGSAQGKLTIAEGAKVRVGNGTGVITLAKDGFSGFGTTGVINIGAAVGETAVQAGSVEAGSIAFGKGNASLNFNHTDTSYVFAPKLEHGSNGAHSVNHMAGSTTLTADSSGFKGKTTVSGGTLIIQNKLGGSAEVTGGTLQYGHGVNGAANTLQGDLKVAGQGSTLSIQKSASLALDGGLDLADDTNLRLEMGATQVALTASNVQIGNGVVLHVNAQQAGGWHNLFSASTAIQGDFSAIHVSGYKQGSDDYETLNTRKSDDGFSYEAFTDLSWTANNNLAHGTFTLKRNEYFSFSDIILQDEKANASLNWDGRTLTKKGAGILELEEANTYSGGTIIKAGELWVSKDQNLGAASASITLDGGTLTAFESFNSARDVNLSSNSSVSVENKKTVQLTGAITGAGDIAKKGQGTLVISGVNNGFTGSTVVSKGKLVVLGTAGDGADVSGGATLQYGDGVQGVKNTLHADLNVKGKNSTLGIQGPATLVVQGAVNLAANTKLALGVGANGTALQADTVTVGTGVGFTLSGITAASSSDTVLIDTATGITGDFSSISVGGFTGTVDYLTLNTRKSDDGKQYLASYSLSWTANNNLANGTFTLVNTTDEFTIATNLSNQAANAATGWNGQTLTKAGAGTLVLSGNNSYAGDTVVHGGTISVSSDSNLGVAGSSVILNGGGLATTASFTSTHQLVLHQTGSMDVAVGTEVNWQGRLSGAGGLTKTGAGTLVLDSTNNYDGVTTLAAGAVQIDADSALGTANSVIFEGGGLATTASFSTTRNAALNQTGYMDVAVNTELNWQGTVSGAGGLTKTGAGTLVLDSTNNYDGVTTLAAGTVQIDADSALGTAHNVVFSGGGVATTSSFTSTRDFNLNKTGTIDVASGTTLGVAGTVVGAGDLHKTGQGTLQLTNTANAYGNTLVQEGTLAATVSSISGNIANAGTVVLNEATDTRFAGHVLALNNQVGQMVKQGQGTLTLVGQSALDWHIAAGQVASAAERFTGNADIDAGASLALHQATNAQYAGQLAGAGTLHKQGQGLLQLTGDSSAFSGNVTIDAGGLAVNGKLGGSQIVSKGAFLGGNGTIGSGTGSVLTVASGGTLSPGNSIGTLTINGDLALQAGSRFEVEVEPQGTAADLVHVTGHASLGGGVAHIGENGNYGLRSEYTILTADGTLSGHFDSVESDFAFLTPELNYDYHAGKVQLALQRNDTSFVSQAATDNQRATAVAIESIGLAAGHSVYDAVAKLANNPKEIQRSFAALSGEIHASTKTALLDDSRFIRDAATDRLRAAFGAAGNNASPVLANQQTVDAHSTGTAAWLQLFGNWGHSDSDGNAHKLKRQTNGFMLGADTSVGDNWRVGAMAGYSYTKSDVRDIGGSNKSDNYHVGVYGGGQWDALGVRLGAAHSWHDMRTTRSVTMPGLSEELKASPKARTTQIFADVGYNIDAGAVQLEPFANLAYVNLHSQRFSEKGGAAALTSRSQHTDTTFMTLGSRLSADIALGETLVTVSASAGWRHAFGGALPKATQRFSEGDAFTITGVPLSRDSAVLEAGVGVKLSRSVSVGLSYQGQLGSDAKDHGVRANVGIAF